MKDFVNTSNNFPLVHLFTFQLLMGRLCFSIILEFEQLDIDTTISIFEKGSINENVNVKDKNVSLQNNLDLFSTLTVEKSQG